MAKRRKRADEPKQITRKEYLRQRKDHRDRQTLLVVLVPILVAVFLFIGYGIFTEMYRVPREPVARVNGEDISTAEFQKRVQYERWALLNNIAAFASLAQSSDPSFLQQMFGNQRDSIGDTTVSKLIDEALIRQEASARGIEVSDEDVQKEINDELATQAAPTPEPPTQEPAEDTEATTVPAEDTGETEGATVEAGDTVTDTEAAGATLSPDKLDKAFDDYVQPFLDQIDFSREDYEHLIRQQVYRDKLSEALGAEVPITAKQVEIDYLVFDTAAKDAAQAAVDEGAAGASWSSIVDKYLREESSEDGPPSESPSQTDAITSTSAITLTQGLTETTSVTETSGITLGEGITMTGSLTATEGVTIGTGSEAAPAPTPEASPFAKERGERGWFTLKGLKETLGLTESDANKVLDAEVDAILGPFQGTGGTYVIVVLDVDENRELEGQELQDRKDGALDEWLTDARTKASIDRFPIEDKIPPEPQWFVVGWERYVKPVPTIDPNALEQPTTESGIKISTVAVPPPGDGGGDSGSDAGSDSGTGGSTP